MAGIVDVDVLGVLKSRFGYGAFLPLQEEIVRHVLGRSHALVLMPTGGGKSLCYQLPALCLDGITLVVSPLIALMKDQVDGLNANGIPAAFVNSSLTASEAAAVLADARAGRVKILYAAPERVATPTFQSFLLSADLSLIAIDEAHCISEWGHDFRPDYRNLRALRDQHPDVPVIALTATATEQVRADIVTQLDITRGRTFVSGFNRENLSYHVRSKRDADQELMALLGDHRDEPTIIYCTSRDDTDTLADRLTRGGFQAIAYHAGMDPQERRAAQDQFIHGDVPIITATIAFGMGIDKPDVRLIVHRDMPKSVEEYYQQTGRAGRDGLPSECVLFYGAGDRVKQAYFIDRIEDDDERSRARSRLTTMSDFCEQESCRRAYLLAYFGESYEQESCGACDVCVAETEEFDATVIAQKIMSAVVRTGETYGAAYVADVIRGSRGRTIRDRGHDTLPVFGIASDTSRTEIIRLIRHLTETGLLARQGRDRPFITVTDAGRAFLRERQPLIIKRPITDQPDAAPRSRQVAGARGPGASRDDRSQPDYDPGLFQALRELRRTLADEQEAPAFVVFGDRTLMEMASHAPQSSDDFARVSGVGAEKLTRYGDAFVTAIRRYVSEHGIAKQASPLPPPTSLPPRQSNTRRATLELLRSGITVNEIAEQRGLTPGTVLNHLELLADEGERVDVGRSLDPARYERIKAAFIRAETPNLGPVHEALGGEFSFEELRIARLNMRLSENV